MAQLVVLKGPNPGSNYSLPRSSTVVGREVGCDIRLEGQPPFVISRKHARFVRTPNGYSVEDLQSTNGTFVNGHQIGGPSPLHNRDEIRLSGVLLVYLEGDGPASLVVDRVSSSPPLVFAGGLNVPDYLAPEQVDERPENLVTSRVDLHAVAVMMYEMLLGESPLPATEFEKLQAIAERRFPSADKRCYLRGIGWRLASVIDRYFAGQFSSAWLFQHALDSFPRDDPNPFGRIARRSPVFGERFRATGLLFEDAVSEAYEAYGESSNAQVTLRLFKPNFNSPSYQNLVRSLAGEGMPYTDDVPASLLWRFQGGRARPLPVQAGNLVEIVDVRETNGCLCLVEEFVGNQTLMAAIQSGKLVGDEGRIATIVYQILQCLEYAHRKGAVHGNLTPYCIFLGPDDEVKVEGFGLHARVEQIRIEEGGDASSVSSIAAPNVPLGQLKSGDSTDDNIQSAINFTTMSMATPEPADPPRNVEAPSPKVPQVPPTRAESEKHAAAAEILKKYMRRPGT